MVGSRVSQKQTNKMEGQKKTFQINPISAFRELPFGLSKGQITLIWTFLKKFARNKMICSFEHFWPF
jgi:hypothetical protein